MDEDNDSPWLEDDEVVAAYPSADGRLPASTSSFAAPSSSSSAPPQSLRSRESQVAQQEWDKISSRYTDEGYRAGITLGKESQLQAGFDQGYAIAAPFARQLGHLRGVAASLLALLTTTAGAKYSSPLLDHLGGTGPSRDEVVASCRALVIMLGKLDEKDVVPVDQEAERHRREHDGDVGESQAMVDRNEMSDINSLMEGLGPGAMSQKVGLTECSTRLQQLLNECGMGAMSLDSSAPASSE